MLPKFQKNKSLKLTPALDRNVFVGKGDFTQQEIEDLWGYNILGAYKHEIFSI